MIIARLRNRSVTTHASRRLAVAPLWALAVAVAVASSTGAHEDAPHPHPHPFPAREQPRPTPLPDRVVLTFSGDPATSIDVCWRTDVTTGEPVAQIARADAILGNLKDGKVPGARNVDGSRQAFESDLGECHMHSVRFDGLEPGVLYAYRVGDGQHWSEWFQFRTAANHPEPFTFVYFGDAQNQLRSLWSRVIREANQIGRAHV